MSLCAFFCTELSASKNTSEFLLPFISKKIKTLCFSPLFCGDLTGETELIAKSVAKKH